MKIARVFPRRTRATPDDVDAYVGPPDLLTPEYDRIHVSVTWTYDLPEAERLSRIWAGRGVVEIGGPATGTRGEEFVPGRYVKHGYVITSRGCPNRCWFCSVWKRDGNTVRELPVADGWNVLDDNLLACSEPHLDRVFAMLKRQSRPVEFTGGLEAARMTRAVVDRLVEVRLKQAFFAYDTPDDLDPLVQAGKMLKEAGIGAHKARCYVLVGHPKDSMMQAEARLMEAIHAGFMPMAMLWRNKAGKVDKTWARFQREWARPTIVGAKMREVRVKEGI